jgi:hypothetical protein
MSIVPRINTNERPKYVKPLPSKRATSGKPLCGFKVFGGRRS